MPDRVPFPQKPVTKAKRPADRLAAALRTNIVRRKKQAKARAQAASDAPTRG